MDMWEKDGVCLLFIGQRASLQCMKWITETLQNIWLNGCSIYTCITDACLPQTMMYSFLSCLKVNELTRLGLLTQTRCDWSVFILQQDLVKICGGVRERVSVWFVYPCMMEDLLMQKAWDAEYFFQICCYGDKYLAESILHSNNDVTQSGAVCCEKALCYLYCIISSFSKTYFQSSSLNKAILIKKRNLKVGVLTAVEKAKFLIIRWYVRTSTMSHFLLELKYFLRNSGALPYFTQLPSKLWEMRSLTTWGKPWHVLAYCSDVLMFSVSQVRLTFSASCNSLNFTFLSFVTT